MNEIKASPEELEEGRRMVSLFRSKGASEYEACLLVAEIQIALRGKP